MEEGHALHDWVSVVWRSRASSVAARVTSPAALVRKSMSEGSPSPWESPRNLECVATSGEEIVGSFAAGAFPYTPSMSSWAPAASRVAPPPPLCSCCCCLEPRIPSRTSTMDQQPPFFFLLQRVLLRIFSTPSVCHLRRGRCFFFFLFYFLGCGVAGGFSTREPAGA